MKRVYIRADSSENIGTGHIMRCLTLAREMTRIGEVLVEFICQELHGNINEIIEDQGFVVNRIEARESFDTTYDAEQTLHILEGNGGGLLIVDSYQVTDWWIKLIRKELDRLFIFIIDDLANRFLSADALLNQNFLPGVESKYKSLVPENCSLYLGPEYALLREEFYVAESLLDNESQKSSIMVFFGGTDPTGETLKVLPVLSKLSKHFEIDIITGANNQGNSQIKKIVSCNSRLNYHCQVGNISYYMAKAKFAIGAGGSTCLERMFFALPSITIVTAENQVEATEYYHAQGLVKNLGWYKSVSEKNIYSACMEFITSPDLLKSYQKNMNKIGVGSRGVTHVAKALV